LTAADVYSAAFAAMFQPLPPEHCDMDAAARAAFSWTLRLPRRSTRFFSSTAT
jgi:hypothetical protein